MRYILAYLLYLLSTATAYAEEFPSSLDHFLENGIKAQFIRWHDPLYVVIKFDTDEIIDVSFRSIDGDDDRLTSKLDKWENTTENKEILVTYSTEEGTLVKIPQTDISFEIIGTMEYSLIDAATESCKEEYYLGMDTGRCENLALKAWDAELNRAYKKLGGSNNPKLKAAQLAWIKFRDAQIKYLDDKYHGRSGSLWRTQYMNDVVSLTSEQARRLKGYVE